MSNLVSLDSESNIFRISLNRPEKRNALTRQLIEELLGAVNTAKSNQQTRLLVLGSSGPVFCAGMDLEEMQARASSAEGQQEWLRDSEIYCQLLESLFTCPFPTVVKLQGPVLAGGVGMVLACDFIVADSDSFFSLPEPLRGITAAIVTPLLVHRVGPGVANQLLLSGERMSVQRAHELGLVYAVAPAATLEEKTSALEQAILSGSPSALAITKQHLNSCSGSDVVQQLRHSISISARARETDDAREGLAAFLQKRKPIWQDCSN